MNVLEVLQVAGYPAFLFTMTAIVVSVGTKR